MITRLLDAGKAARDRSVTLCPPTASRARAPFELVSDAELMKYFMLGRPPYAPHEFESYQGLVQRVIDHPQRWAWWIHVENTFAGLVATKEAYVEPFIQPLRCVPIYYVLKETYQHQGIATLAVERATRYLLGEAAIDAVKAEILAPNTASIRLIERLGFILKRTKPNGYKDEHGKTYDVHHYYRYRPYR